MPHIHEHINMSGRCCFVVPEPVVLGELRPLPTPADHDELVALITSLEPSRLDATKLVASEPGSLGH